MFASANEQFISGFDDYLIQLAVALAIFVIGLVAYVLLTPHKELALIRDGNPSAAVAFGGVVVGIAIPLGACLAHSFSVMDLVIWGVVTLLIQLIAFRVTDMLLHGLPRRIAEGDVAAALMVMSVKLGVALILAGAVSDPALNMFRSSALDGLMRATALG
jgi:putative membrane protein